MTRREFRLISGAGATPTIEDITKRKGARRHFKTIHAGGTPTKGRKIYAVTIKGIDKTDGVTIWEYGPGSFWRHHYGADEITGVVPNLSATLNKYAIGAYSGTVYVNAGNRNSATLTANVAEPLTITKLNSLDGTVIESAAMTGMFCDIVTDSLYQLSQGIAITEAAALSGGNYVIVGQRVPFIEFLDFTSNTASKSYILHGHNQQGGNAYLKTRTSSEVITIPYNATAAEVETLFEATADCTAATVSGGPWPHLPIEIDVTWSAAGGDIAAIKTDATYLTDGPGTGSADWEWSGVAWVLITDNCTVGEPDDPPYDGTMVSEPYTSGCIIPASVSTNTGGVAATYDTATGEIQNSVGRMFGRNASESLTRLIASTATIPSVTGVSDQGIYQIHPGPSDSVLIIPSVNTSGKAATVECHTVGATWTQVWKKYNNTGSVFGIHIDSGLFCMSFAAQAFAGGGTAGAVLVDAVAGTTTEYNPPWGSLATTFQQNQSLTLMFVGDPTTKCGNEYELTVTDSEYPNVRFRNHFAGSEVWHDGNEMLLGVNPVFGAETTAVYGISRAVVAIANYNPPLRTPTGSIYKTYNWSFHVPTYSRFGSATEWRFRFGTSYTSWLAWTDTEATIKSAILTIFPENTSGIISNVVINPFGSPSSIINTDASWLEQGLAINFNASADSAGVFYGFPAGSRFVNGQVAIEFRSVANYTAPGIAAWDPSDASAIWTRPFGTSLATSAEVTYPQSVWLRGDFVYAAGQLLENELP